MADDEVEAPLDPTLTNVLEATSLRWIFVGGKGGVGKTTTSCSLAVQLAGVRENVLVVSTDPAHNLSDAFHQKFTREPTLVDGFDNLYCMELEAKMDDSMLSALAGIDGGSGSGSGGGAEGGGGDGAGGIMSLLTDLPKSLPGIDEIMAFLEVMKTVQTARFSCVVFDTAPTGHTLRLLGFPEVLQKGLSKILALKSKFGGLMGPLSAMMGGPGGAGGAADATAMMTGKLEEIQELVNKTTALLRDPDHTTFVPVCIPEFLSLYETERLLQELARFEIDAHNVVVNQVLPVATTDSCPRCIKRRAMQHKYLDQIADLYEDYHVTVTPLLDGEVRGTAALKAYGGYLTSPYDFSDKKE